MQPETLQTQIAGRPIKRRPTFGIVRLIDFTSILRLISLLERKLKRVIPPGTLPARRFRLDL